MPAAVRQAVTTMVLLAVLVTGCGGSGPSPLDPASAAGAPLTQVNITGINGFIGDCTFARHSSADPIRVQGGGSGMHLHAFFGKDGNGTTCRHQGETGTYWVPALLSGGTLVEPLALRAYYRAADGVEAAVVEPYPPGLAMIAGEVHGLPPVNVAGWACARTLDHRTPEPPHCPNGEGLHMVVIFADCWDGSRTDSPGHRGHLRYSQAGTCPESHQVHVPQLILDVRYPPVDKTRALQLSSGPVAELHADFLNTWDQPTLEDKVLRCITRAELCPAF